VVTSDGRFIWIREEINVVRDAAGKPAGFRGLIAAVPGPAAGREREVSMDDRQRSSLEIRDDEIDIPSFLKDR